MKKLTLSAILLFLLIVAAQGNSKPEADQVTDEQIIEAVEALKFVKPVQKPKILIFSLTNGFVHKSIPTGIKALEIMAGYTQAFEVVASNDLTNFEPENIGQFDAICFLNTTNEVFSPSKKQRKTMTNEDRKAWSIKEKRIKESLMNFIKGGKGFIGFHSATDTFYKWPEYGEMIGGYFDGHPWSAKTNVDIKIEEGQEEHCCVMHMGIENLSFKEEIYQFKDPYEVNKLEVILRLDPEKNDLTIGKRKDQDYPVSWVKRHGEGRVFYSSIGHNNHVFANQKVLQHFLNGILWSTSKMTSVK